MSLQVEKLEKNMAKLTIEVPAEEFTEAIKTAYIKNKNHFNIPGFRRGKAPQAMIEKMYGAEIFYEDAANEILPVSFEDAAKESGLDIVSRPDIELKQMEKGKPFIYEATVALKPEVTLGEYKGVEVEKAAAEVTEEDVEKELKRVQDQNSRLISVTDRPVADGDQVIIDFDGYVDGKQFDGGKAEDYPLVIGSHSFIDTFEEQLIGKNVGDECEVNVTFPTEYHAEELKGKPAVFKVTLNKVEKKELPEIDDKYVSDTTEFETVDEYKKAIKENLLKMAQERAERDFEVKLLDEIAEKSNIEVPDSMVEHELHHMIEDFEHRLSHQGLNLTTYLEYIGKTMDEFKPERAEDARKNIKTRLVLQKLISENNITVTSEELDNSIAEYANRYQMTAEDFKKAMSPDDYAYFENNAIMTKVLNMIKSKIK